MIYLKSKSISGIMPQQEDRSPSPFKAKFQGLHFNEIEQRKFDAQRERAAALSPENRHLKFESRSSSRLVPCSREEAEARETGDFSKLAGSKSKEKASGYSDERAQFLALQDARRQALWTEVHDGFHEVVSSFQEFHEVLHGDVEDLGIRLTERQKKKMREQLKQKEYIGSLEGIM